MTKDLSREYLKNRIETASPGELIVIMYEAAIKFLEKAEKGFEEPDVSKKIETINNNLLLAQNIITELTLSLKMDAGEVARNLFVLYEFMNQSLIDANIKKELKPIQVVKDMMTQLKEAWETVAKKTSLDSQVQASAGKEKSVDIRQ